MIEIELTLALQPQAISRAKRQQYKCLPRPPSYNYHYHHIPRSVLTRTFDIPRHQEPLVAFAKFPNGFVPRAFCFRLVRFQPFVRVLEKHRHLGFILCRVLLPLGTLRLAQRLR